eukprot:TRINITY_DN32425_c0_g1_i1.p1 TRINITY_DN32425_c0_g1~~TRINITY_DN32425_c0_g1_i1.p1  ORF type:complete len:464 (+),score=156.83 TRINITY_DN32425_c0_g1_i1:211-1602(+)
MRTGGVATTGGAASGNAGGDDDDESSSGSASDSDVDDESSGRPRPGAASAMSEQEAKDLVLRAWRSFNALSGIDRRKVEERARARKQHIELEEDWPDFEDTPLPPSVARISAALAPQQQATTRASAKSPRPSATATVTLSNTTTVLSVLKGTSVGPRRSAPLTAHPARTPAALPREGPPPPPRMSPQQASNMIVETWRTFKSLDHATRQAAIERAHERAESGQSIAPKSFSWHWDVDLTVRRKFDYSGSADRDDRMSPIEAAIVIQRAYRQYLVKRFNKTVTAALLVQRAFRKWRAYRQAREKLTKLKLRRDKRTQKRRAKETGGDKANAGSKNTRRPLRSGSSLLEVAKQTAVIDDDEKLDLNELRVDLKHLTAELRDTAAVMIQRAFRNHRLRGELARSRAQRGALDVADPVFDRELDQILESATTISRLPTRVLYHDLVLFAKRKAVTKQKIAKAEGRKS